VQNLRNLWNLCEAVCATPTALSRGWPWDTRMRQPRCGSSHTCLPSEIG
jgi:hypothetical protein